jgi:hypothetical protein
LRAAIEESNALAGVDTINFQVGSGGQQVLSLTSTLPPITDTVIIDGTSQPSPSGGPRILINGQDMAERIFDVQASNSIIRGLVLNRSKGEAIVLAGDNNRIIGNFIGTDFSGLSGPGNTGVGVVVIGPGSNNVIGGTAPGEPNVIAFNSIGVLIVGGFSNSVLSNSIFNNAELGIDLNIDPTGVSPNDICDTDGSANNTQNFPDLTAATSGFGNITIQGSLNSEPNTAYRVEFFANNACDNLGFGEGQRFIGSTVVTTSTNCGATFTANFATTVAIGQSITATATDPAGNTSEFSECEPVTPVTCAITCPAGILSPNDPNQCGATINYSTPVLTGTCGAVTCSPPSGSFFPVGTTTVDCVTAAPAPGGGGPACSFMVIIFDNQRPMINCPANVTATVAQGQTTRVVDYPAPTVTDNCEGASAGCTPPSGSAFPIGTTVVTCFAGDQTGNSAGCLFNVIVNDPSPAAIICPANLTASAPAGQCSAIVNYPAPTVTGPANTVITCTPPAGSSFPAGATTVNCVAVTAAGSRATCAFIVTVNAGVQARVILEGGGTTLDFGVAPATRRPQSNPTSRTFTIENTGCGRLDLAFSSSLRTGPDVTSGRITNPDDRETFPLTIIDPNGTERPAVCDAGAFCIQIARGQSMTFRVRFNRVIPPYAGRTTGLDAAQVLPDTVTSQITFSQAGGPPLVVNLVGRVTPAAQLIHPRKAKKAARVTFSREGDEYVVTFGFHDPNLNATQARYELLGSNGQVVEAFDVNLTEAINAANPVRGQSLAVTQRFSGANDNPNVTGVRLTLTDGEGNATISSASSRQALSAASIHDGTGARPTTLYAGRAVIIP